MPCIAYLIVPPTPITGPDSICAYYTYHYTDSVAGGLWSNNTALGSIVGGYLTGMNPGVDTVVYIINYIAPVTCAVRCTKGVRIDVAPNAGTIQGIDSVCPGDSVVLMATVPGGAWTAQNSRAAISATGTVTGITPGTDMITYTVANACGTVTTQKLIKVRTAASCALSVADESSDDIVVLIYPDPATSILTVSAGNAINQIRITDLTGRTVYNEHYNAVKIDIDLTNLASGMYFMKINEGIVRKFVKQ